MRTYTPADHFILHLDTGIRTLFGRPQPTSRPDPAARYHEHEMTEKEQQVSARLMRINHSGEVAAQGLYQGQALTAKLPRVRAQMERAALEENDHLIWCEQRVRAMGQRTSFLNPVWYAGSVTIGAIAGAAGDKWSLGFVAETEKQVVRHLDEHLQQLPPQDEKSRAILDQMKSDENEHAINARRAGGAPLPASIRKLMQLTAKVMTKTAYWI